MGSKQVLTQAYRKMRILDKISFKPLSGPVKIICQCYTWKDLGKTFSPIGYKTGDYIDLGITVSGLELRAPFKMLDKNLYLKPMTKNVLDLRARPSYDGYHYQGRSDLTERTIVSGLLPISTYQHSIVSYR